MTEYHKIQTVYKRDPDTKFKTLLDGDFSLPEFEYLRGNQWAFTEKVDGTNIRVIYRSRVLSFGGRTDRAQIPATLLKYLCSTFTSRLLSEVFGGPDRVVLYGEGYGPKIQKGGGNYRQDQSFVLFDVKIGPFWLRRADVNDVACKLGIESVPIIGLGTLHAMVEKTARGFNSIWGDFRAEGIVARPTTELLTRSNRRIITKIKCKDFKHD